ncbi:hypothetical protein OSB04_004704 [Centaurea solstitialis]|uniref:Bidirectional sugar transporter SWEET n=1 Tax=Centaurea solstitialis TaxID=347529 RepID=A0AA38TEL9_9ASTR|nr:hypothetical protein OSB04_004704 [Centaurea solstitialis]
MVPSHYPHLTLAFGLLGNVVSFMVFLSPLPTFYKVYKKKSTEGFQSIPYVIGLFSAMLWIYTHCSKEMQCFLSPLTPLVSSYNHFTLSSSLSMHHPEPGYMESLKLIVAFIVVGFGLIVLLTQFLVKGAKQGVIVGWICLVFSLCVFVAPLGVLVTTSDQDKKCRVHANSSVICAHAQCRYVVLLRSTSRGLQHRDSQHAWIHFGIIQMILYFIYKNKKPVINDKITEFKERMSMDEPRGVVPDIKGQNTIDMVKLNALIASENVPNNIPQGVVRNHTIEVAA